MDLLKYLEPMRNLPKRFSNLAFWRDVRKFKDEVVNALEYVDSWGTHIETLLPSNDYVKSSSLKLLSDSIILSDWSTSCITLSTNKSNETTELIPTLSVVGSVGGINLSTDKASVLYGKTIDSVVFNYVTSDKIGISFVLPTGAFRSVYIKGKYVNGYVYNQGSFLARKLLISNSDIEKYANPTFDNIMFYYH